MNNSEVATIYTDGGTVQAGPGLYLPRQADEKLLALCRAGGFAYVLTARQMGKSSLMVNVARRLSAEGRRAVTIDLTRIGAGPAITAEQWYLGLLVEIVSRLRLNVDLVKWWREHAYISVAQRLNGFFESVVLAQIAEPIVIFVDEIDTTIRLPFTDDFYAAIRYLYNDRSRVGAFDRLSFVLIGVATPNSLIRNPDQTPFNIGTQVDLTDFTFDEVAELASGLTSSDGDSSSAMRWVYEWTGGHPYLTQKLCMAVAKAHLTTVTKSHVARIVSEVFFGAHGEQDSNIQFVRDMLTRRIPDQIDPAEVILTYRDIYRKRKRIVDEERSTIKSHLKLSGVVISSKGTLAVRNKVYWSIFDELWVRQHVPKTWVRQQYHRTRRIAVALATLLVVFGGLTIYAEKQRRRAESERSRAEMLAARETAARKVADQQRMEALQSTATAAKALSREKEARLSAEDASREADLQSARAEGLAKREQSARRLADQGRAEADRQKQIAELRGQTDRLYREGTAQYLSRNIPAAIGLFENALQLYGNSHINDVQGRGVTLRNIAQARVANGEPEKGLRYYQDAQELYQRANDSDSITSIQIETAWVLKNLGRRDEAKNLLIQAQQLFRKTNNKEGEISVLLNLAAIFFDLRDHENDESAIESLTGSRGDAEKKKADMLTAIQYYDEAMELYHGMNNDRGEADLFRETARIYELIPDRANAVERYLRVAKLLYAQNRIFEEAQLYYLLGSKYSSWKESNKAREYYNAAAEKANMVGESVFQANCYLSIAGTYDDKKGIREKQPHYRMALQAFERAKNISGQVQVLRQLAESYWQNGDSKNANELLERALAVYDGDVAGSRDISQIREIATIYVTMRRELRGIELYHRALKAYTANSDSKGQQSMNILIGRAYYSLREYDKANLYYRTALQLARQAGEENEEALILSAMGTIAMSAGDTDRAEANFRQALEIHRKLENNSGEREMLDSISILLFAKKDKRAVDVLRTSMELESGLSPESVEDGEISSEENANLVIGSILLDELGLEGERGRYIDAYLECERCTDIASKARRMRSIGALYSDIGDHDRGLEYCRRALAEFEGIDEIGEQVQTLVVTGFIWNERGDRITAYEYAARAYRIATESEEGRPGDKSSMFMSVAKLYGRLKDKAMWRKVFREALLQPQKLPEATSFSHRT